MNSKLIRERLATVHFHTQRVTAIALGLVAGIFSIVMLAALGGDYGPDSPEPTRWVLKSLACFGIACVAAWLHFRIMKAKYPDYPHHKKDDGYPPIY